ncbi:hypothetical protein AAG906_022153 [Vitis piasezkii]
MGNPPRLRFSACVEVMTTLHGSIRLFGDLLEVACYWRLGMIIPTKDQTKVVLQVQILLASLLNLDDDRIRIRHMRVIDGQSICYDMDRVSATSLPTKFRMLDIDHYTAIECPYIHLRLYNTVM